MLKSRYQAMCLGLSPWSLIHALILRQQGKDVLVVDDQNLATDAPGLHRLTLLELASLRDLGHRKHLPLLADLSAFLRPTTLTVHLPSQQWIAGPEVLHNLREFVRKFKFLQTPSLLATLERPESELRAELERVTQEFVQWFNSSLVRQRGMLPFTSNSAAWVSEFQRLVFEEHARPYTGPEVSGLTQLIAAYSSTTDQVVKYRLDPHESWVLCFRLLSPVWELDRRWFERELTRALIAAGGHTKKSRVHSWQIYRNRVEAALLDSYEGVISHDRLLLYGFPPPEGQLQCRFKERTFRGVEFTWGDPMATPAVEEEALKLTAFTSSGQLGTTLPVGFMEQGPGHGRLVALVAEAQGMKQEFAHKEAWENLSGHLQRALPFGATPWEKAKPRRSWGFWVEEGPRARRSPKSSLMHHERRGVEVVDRITQEPLSGVELWGPLRSQYFGAVGFLSDLRWDQLK